MWLSGSLLALLIGFAITMFVRGQGGEISNVTTIAVEAGHQEGAISYAQAPPAGGPHNAVWQNCGIYDQTISNENAVHSLEHGAVWVTHRPELSTEDVEALRAQIRGKRYTLLSPYAGLPAPVVASAWGVQLQLSGPDDPRLESFLATYRQGPQAPEPGAACYSGTGIPSDI